MRTQLRENQICHSGPYFARSTIVLWSSYYCRASRAFKVKISKTHGSANCVYTHHKYLLFDQMQHFLNRVAQSCRTISCSCASLQDAKSAGTACLAVQIHSMHSNVYCMLKAATHAHNAATQLLPRSKPVLLSVARNTTMKLIGSRLEQKLSGSIRCTRGKLLTSSNSTVHICIK